MGYILEAIYSNWQVSVSVCNGTLKKSLSQADEILTSLLGIYRFVCSFNKKRLQIHPCIGAKA